MLTANYYTIDGYPVGDKVEFGTDDLEFAALQAKAVTGMKVIRIAKNFAVLADDKRRIVIS